MWKESAPTAPAMTTLTMRLPTNRPAVLLADTPLSARKRGNNRMRRCEKQRLQSTRNSGRSATRHTVHRQLCLRRTKQRMQHKQNRRQQRQLTERGDGRCHGERARERRHSHIGAVRRGIVGRIDEQERVRLPVLRELQPQGQNQARRRLAAEWSRAATRTEGASAVAVHSSQHARRRTAFDRPSARERERKDHSTTAKWRRAETTRPARLRRKSSVRTPSTAGGSGR